MSGGQSAAPYDHPVPARVRAAVIRGVDGLIDDLGGSSDELLSACGVSAEDLHSDDAVIPAAAAVRVLRTAAEVLHCPDLGLRLAARQDLSTLGVLGLAMANSETIGTALDCASQFLFVQNQTVQVRRAPDPERLAGTSAVVYQLSPPDLSHEPQAVDAGVGLLHRVLVTMSGGYELRGVHLPHPPLADPSVYRDFFGSPVRFDARGALLRVPTRLFAEPMALPVHRELQQMVVSYLQSVYVDPGSGLTATVRAAVGRGLGTVPSRIEVYAAPLHMHPRTLQRRLAAEGTTFEAIVDSARRSAAQRLLTQTDVPLSQIALMIELAGSPSLTRACRRWFDRTPSQLRRAAAARVFPLSRRGK